MSKSSTGWFCCRGVSTRLKIVSKPKALRGHRHARPMLPMRSASNPPVAFWPTYLTKSSQGVYDRV
ncbi:UNVERIFIED_CONTAM: hypothetical protein GTU68_052882 [Idotea baltica]|nr:hypothetical protein [Idotea baltica]